MTRWNSLLAATLLWAALAPVAVFGNGHTSNEPAPIGPDYQAHPPASDTAALADAKKYFDEGSYQWALAAAQFLANKWPSSTARPEGDWIALRCYFHLDMAAEADRGLKDYLKRYKKGAFAADAADLYVDAYSECRDVYDSYGWQQYLTEKYGYNFYGGDRGRDKLDRKREQVLREITGIYNNLAAQAPAEEAAKLRDRLAVDYLIMFSWFDWEGKGDKPRQAYDNRLAFLSRVAALPQSPAMASLVAFEEGLVDISYLPASREEWEASGQRSAEYETWLARKRLEAALARWDAVAAEHGDAPGALLATAARAHYNVIYYNEPAKAALALEELAGILKDTNYQSYLQRYAEHLRMPALAITGVTANPELSPPVQIELACRVVSDVNLKVWTVDPAKYLDLQRELAKTYASITNPPAGDKGALGYAEGRRPVPVVKLPGITKEAASWSMPTGCDPADYRIKQVLATRDDLPPGLYLVEATAGDEYSRAMFLLTRAAAVTTCDGEELFMQIVDATTGKPSDFDVAAALNIYWKPDEKGYSREYTEAVKIEKRSAENGVVADLTKYKTNSNLLFVLTSPLGPAIYRSRTGYGVRDKTAVTGTVITDRPLYRPGDKVSYKAILRRVDYIEKVLAPIAGQDVEVFLYGADGQEMWKGTGKSDAYGTVAGELTPPAGIKLGNESITLKWKEGDKERVVSGYFALEEYEKPEYEVVMTPAKRFYLSGEKATVDVSAKYYFGAPMAGATAAWEITREGYTKGGAYDYDKLVKKGTGVIDAEGHLALMFDTTGAKEYDNYYTIHLKLTDQSQRVVEEYSYVTTYKTDRFVSVSTDKNEYRKGEPMKVLVNAYDWDDKPVTAPIRVVAYEYGYNPEKGYVRGRVLYEGSVTTDAEGEGQLELRLTDTTPEMEIAAHITGTNGADYETSVTLQVVDEATETTVRKPEIGITADNTYPSVGDQVQITLESRFDEAECQLTYYAGRIIGVKHITLTKADIGSSASFLLPMDELMVPNMTIYAQVLRDGASWNTSYSLYVANPNVRMKVEVKPGKDDYRPAEEATVSVACTDPKGLPLKADMSLAVVDSSLLALRADMTYGVPGQMEYALNRYGYAAVGDSLADRGYVGNAVFWFPYYPFAYGAYGTSFLPYYDTPWGPAENIITRIYFPGVSDPALGKWFEIADNDLLERERRGWTGGEGFYGSGEGYGTGMGGGGSVGAASPTVTMAESTVSGRSLKTKGMMDFEEAPAEAMDEMKKEADKNGAKKPEAGPVQPVLRKEFLDTAYWVANLRTDESGAATATFKLPDNLTEWRAMALALDDGQRFGWSAAAFNVNKFIIARLKAPRYMVAGDVARLTAQGHNYLKVAKNLELKVEAEGLNHIKGDTSATSEVAADGKAVLYDWVEAPKAGKARLVTSALTDVESDAAESFVPIYPHGSQYRQAFAGRLRMEVSHELTLAPGVDPATFTGELYVTPSLAATLSHGLDYFKDYPYDCVEQTLNRFRINALLAAAAADLQLDKTKLAEGLDKSIDEGVARMAESQTPEGGWPWWKGGKESPYMTAYAIDGLAALRGNPFVSEPSAKKMDEMYGKGAAYLKHYLDEWHAYHDRYPHTLSLYIADVALRAGMIAPDDDYMNELADYYFEYRGPRNDYSNALLASVLHQLGKEDKVAVVLRNLDNGVKRGSDNTLHWGEDPDRCWYWWDDSVEATSRVLEAKLAYKADDPQISYIVDWLVDQRRGAAWKSTKDSAAATTALMHYIKARPELAAPIVTTYMVGAKAGGLELDPTAYEKPGEKVEFAVEDFKVGANAMTLKRDSGEGPVFYTMAVEYYAEAKDLPAVQGSVTLERNFYIIKKEVKKGRIKEKMQPLNRPLKPGEEVMVELKINSPYDFDYVVLEAPKPAGFVDIETASGYSWYLNAYTELWNKQRTLFFERLNAGKTTVTYRIRAEVPGNFAALPARIWGMYSPDIGSNTASARVEIAEE